MVASSERLSVATTKSTPASQVVRDLRVDDVGLVADEEGHDELHATGRLVLGPGDPLVSEREAKGPAPDVTLHAEQGELRAIRADRTPLGEAVSRAGRPPTRREGRTVRPRAV